MVQFSIGRIIGLSGGSGGVNVCSNDLETETAGTITSLTHPTNAGDLAFATGHFVTQAGDLCFNDFETETAGAITQFANGTDSGDCAFNDAASRFV